MQWPTWNQRPESPSLDRPGVKVALGATVFREGEPVALYGTYVADAQFYAKTHGDVSSWVFVIVVARDLPDAWARPLVEKPVSVPLPTKPFPVPNKSFIQQGFFNLDLREHLHLSDQPSRYWVQVAMGEHFSERLSFELK